MSICRILQINLPRQSTFPFPPSHFRRHNSSFPRVFVCGRAGGHGGRRRARQGNTKWILTSHSSHPLVYRSARESMNLLSSYAFESSYNKIFPGPFGSKKSACSCFLPAKQWLGGRAPWQAPSASAVALFLCLALCPFPSLPRPYSLSSACSIYTFSRDGFSMSHPLPPPLPPLPHSLKFDLPLLRWHSQPG